MLGTDVRSTKGSSVMWVSSVSVDTRDSHTFHLQMQNKDPAALKLLNIQDLKQSQVTFKQNSCTSRKHKNLVTVNRVATFLPT